MKIAKQAILQAIVIVVLALIVAFTFNTFSASRINPFKQKAPVPLKTDTLLTATEGIRIIDLEEAKKFIGSGAPVIDARRKEQYDEGHLPGAILLDYYDMPRYLDEVLPLLSKDQEIMVYCEGADCEASQLLAQEFFALGFKRLLLYKNGFEEWSAAGLPLEKDSQ